VHAGPHQQGVTREHGIQQTHDLVKEGRRAALENVSVLNEGPVLMPQYLGTQVMREVLQEVGALFVDAHLERHVTPQLVLQVGGEAGAVGEGGQQPHLVVLQKRRVQKRVREGVSAEQSKGGTRNHDSDMSSKVER
jgi:hypothetical protein